MSPFPRLQPALAPVAPLPPRGLVESVTFSMANDTSSRYSTKVARLPFSRSPSRNLAREISWPEWEHPTSKARRRSAGLRSCDASTRSRSMFGRTKACRTYRRHSAGSCRKGAVPGYPP